MVYNKLLDCVLCVEDEATARMYLQTILVKRFHKVICAKDGVEGLALFQQHKPAIVITDLAMPNLDGLAMARQIMEASPLTHIVITTALNTIETILSATSVGISDFIVKPVSAERLERSIDRFERIHHLEQEVLASNNQIETIIASIQDIFFATDCDLRITYMNAVAKEYFKPLNQTLFNKGMLEIFKDSSAITECLKALPILKCEFFEYRSQINSNWYEIRIFPLESGGITVFMRDIEALKKTEADLRHSSFFDKLTNLPNRVSLQHFIVNSITNSRKHGTQVALLFMDLDRFKYVNDALGHATGDKLLIEVGARIKSCIRDVDLVARFGGDAFIVVLTNIGQEAIKLVLDRIFKALSRDILFDNQVLNMAVSVGISLFPKDADDYEGLLKAADIAMYYGKTSGKSTYQFYDPSMSANSQNRLTLETALRRSDFDRDFYLEYQAKVNLEDDSLVGFEALVRWNHPQLGFLPPAQFIPLAEETGLIIPLGAWVFRTVCRQGAEWLARTRTPFTLAVNISGRQFWQGDLVQSVQEALELSHCPPGLIELEITEGTIVRDFDSAIAKMHQLVDLGFKLSIDDFGTGYSSLGSLKKFPLSSLKIDKSFVDNITTDKNDSAISNAIISLSHAMDLVVIAEGIETDAQRAFLKQAGCDIGQGYLFSKPISPKLVEEKYLYI